jgi:adenosylcobyric acid synthase
VNDFKIIGTYIHGIFDNPEITALWLNRIGLPNIKTSKLEGIEARDKEYDLLAEHFEAHIQTDSIIEIINHH